MSRHPYTHAADFIRALAGYGEHGMKLSRADASTIRQGIAKVIGVDDEALAILLSNAEQEKTEADHEKSAQDFMRSFVR